MNKLCTKCKKEKSINEFYTNQHYCKVCIKEYYNKNKKQILKYNKEYYKKNKNKLLNQKKEYYQDNKENMVDKRKKYYQDNKVTLENSRRCRKENNKEKYLLACAKERSLKNNIEFNLIEGDIEVLDVCPLLGIKMKINKKVSKYNSYTLDRIDAAKGYIKGNVQVISKKANTSKSDASIEEYEKIINNLEDIINNGVKVGHYEKNVGINFNYIIKNARKRSKNNNLLFNIDIDYLKTIYPKNNKCPLLCIDLKKGNVKSQNCSPSLDRIIPNLGYIKGNIMFISHRANTIKNNLTLDEMKLLLYNWKRRVDG